VLLLTVTVALPPKEKFRMPPPVRPPKPVFWLIVLLRTVSLPPAVL
jgi:hypothetical protein